MSERSQLNVPGGAPSFAPRVGKEPGFFSRSSSALLLVLLVAMEAGVVYFVIRDVRSANHEVQKMYASSRDIPFSETRKSIISRVAIRAASFKSGLRPMVMK